MAKKILLFAGAVLFLGGAFLVMSGMVARRSGVWTAHFDKSIKIEDGTPIMVRWAIDGDTIELVNGDRLRYIGIDTPEDVDPGWPVQCFAREAAEKNKELVEGKTISFYKDVSARDRYGRLLGFAYLGDGTFVNLELVKDGFAFNYPHQPDISRADIFRAAEAEARKKNLGLWAACAVHKDSNGRNRTNSLK